MRQLDYFLIKVDVGLLENDYHFLSQMFGLEYLRNKIDWKKISKNSWISFKIKNDITFKKNVKMLKKLTY